MSKKAGEAKKAEPSKAGEPALLVNEHLLKRAEKEVRGLDYVTPFTLSTRLGVKISLAKRLLRTLEKEGKVRLVAPSRRDPLYVPAEKQ